MWTMHIQLFDFDKVNLLAPLETNSVCVGHKSGGPASGTPSQQPLVVRWLQETILKFVKLCGV